MKRSRQWWRLMKVELTDSEAAALAATGPWCACGHVALIHGDGGCKGVLTPFDGAPRVMPCECQGFR